MLIPEISEEEAENLLQDAIHEKFAVFGDVCFICMILQCIAYYIVLLRIRFRSYDLRILPRQLMPKMKTRKSILWLKRNN